MRAPVLLEARGLAKRFRRRPVLRDVTMVLQAGVVVGVVGENGSGKTTLIRVLSGMLSPDGGSVLVRGRLGYCPQEPLLFGDLTVEEHLRYFAAAYGLASWREPGNRLLDCLGFRDRLRDRVDQLSGGTRQKLNLALALLHSPEVILLDEPYASFDAKTYAAFWDLMAQLRGAGRALLIVSPLIHDLGRFDVVAEIAEGVLR